MIREAPARFVELVGGDPEVEEHADGCGYPGLVEQAAEVGEIALEDGHVGMAGQVGMGERVGITVDAYESCSFSHLVHQSPRVPPTAERGVDHHADGKGLEHLCDLGSEDRLVVAALSPIGARSLGHGQPPGRWHQ